MGNKKRKNKTAKELKHLGAYVYFIRVMKPKPSKKPQRNRLHKGDETENKLKTPAESSS
jgi:hypothetical protein